MRSCFLKLHHAAAGMLIHCLSQHHQQIVDQQTCSSNDGHQHAWACAILQVQQLARELAALHHKHQQDLLQQHQQQLAAAISRERGNLAATQQAELAAVRDELGRLRAATVTADPGPFDTWGGVHRVSAAAAAAAAPDSPSTCSSSSWGSTCRPQGQLQRTRDRRHQQGRQGGRGGDAAEAVC